MKLLLHLLSVSALFASAFANEASGAIDTADFVSTLTCEGDDSCDLEKRAPQVWGQAGAPPIAAAKPYENWYCNARDSNKFSCDGDNPKGKLIHQVCTAYCSCNPDKGTYTCLHWNKCDARVMKEKCKCWAFKLGSGTELVCGSTPIEARATKLPTPSTSRAAAKNTGL